MIRMANCALLFGATLSGISPATISLAAADPADFSAPVPALLVSPAFGGYRAAQEPELADWIEVNREVNGANHASKHGVHVGPSPEPRVDTAPSTTPVPDPHADHRTNH